MHTREREESKNINARLMGNSFEKSSHNAQQTSDPVDQGVCSLRFHGVLVQQCRMLLEEVVMFGTTNNTTYTARTPRASTPTCTLPQHDFQHHQTQPTHQVSTVTLSRCHAITLPRCHAATLPRRHSVTVSQCHNVSVSRFCRH